MAYTDEEKQKFINAIPATNIEAILMDMLKGTMGQRDALQKRYDELVNAIDLLQVRMKKND